jgi:hypothetical protein
MALKQIDVKTAPTPNSFRGFIGFGEIPEFIMVYLPRTYELLLIGFDEGVDGRILGLGMKLFHEWIYLYLT